MPTAVRQSRRQPLIWRSSMDALARLRELKLPFAELMGIEFTAAAPERVVAEMAVREDLCTRPAVLHGGAIMAFADTLGAAARAPRQAPRRACVCRYRCRCRPW